jgi:hypothetical protein
VDRPAVFHLEEATFFKALTQTAKVADESQGFICSRLLCKNTLNKSRSMATGMRLSN